MEEDNLIEKFYDEIEGRLAFIDGVEYVSMVDCRLVIAYRPKGVNVALLRSAVEGVLQGRWPYTVVPAYSPEAETKKLDRNLRLLDF